MSWLHLHTGDGRASSLSWMPISRLKSSSATVILRASISLGWVSRHRLSAGMISNASFVCLIITSGIRTLVSKELVELHQLLSVGMI